MPKINKDPKAVFEELWKGIDENYSLFEYSKINWDSIHNVYGSKIYDKMTEKALYDTLSKMLFELKDGHTNIKPEGSPFINEKYYSDVSLYPSNYNKNIVLNNYFYNYNPIIINQTYGHGYTWLGTTNVGYMIYMQFRAIDESVFTTMLNYFKNAKGLIIDLRDNGGGNDNAVFLMLSHFTNKKIHVANIKYKNGNKHSDFSDNFPVYIEPKEPFYNKKIVILTNRAVFSAANEMVNFASELENITIIGGKTGGGIGIPSRHYLSNGWSYRTSNTILSGPNGIITYDTNPDIEATATYNSNKDEIIETALNFLK